ncbi:unnamed protein product [Coffea canephora]|uniref:Uncharacterized protein n=1 Tax=Coffea canephora TaxID=49390 RepID=A0A068U1M3_COFCA|nr:unnamed protein product [Coffea canephora]
MMMMNSGGCIAAGCIDAQSPVKLSPAKLQQWAEADREFLRAICMNKGSPSCSSPMAAPNNNINVGRQRYLRSYKFSKKETFAQRTKKLWLKVKHDSKVDSDHHHQEGSAAGRPACSGLIYIFRFYFVCMAEVDVA